MNSKRHYTIRLFTKPIEISMPSLKELFGTDEHGQALVSLDSAEGQAAQDIILPVCYRNTPWALTLAHALGFGIYRKGTLVQHFDEPALWSEIGYRVVSGSLEAGKKVTLERRRDSFPEYFETLLSVDDAVTCNSFDSEIAQAEWVAQKIKDNLEKDELEHDDILIVLPNALTAKTRVVSIRDALGRHGIESHLAGVTSSTDQMFSNRSIAISNIYRAKGNEAPMVYVLNCQHSMGEYERIKPRNTLFTAITRSRAWIRLCGFGPGVDALMEEVRRVKDKQYRLQFKVPTAEELAKMRRIHRDRTPAEKDKIRRAEKGLEQFLEAIKDGDIEPESLPADVRERLRAIIVASGQDDDDT